MLPCPPMPRVILRKLFRFPAVTTISLVDERGGKSLGLCCISVRQFGNTEDLEKLTVREFCGGFGRPFPVLESTKCCGSKPCQAFVKWQVPLNPIESFG